jgi:chromosome partitioning protein
VTPPVRAPGHDAEMKVLATYNIKGGVGKTATAVNLAYLAAEAGARTLVWDLDPQGAASFYFRVKPKVKGGAEAIIGGRRALDQAIKGTDYDNLDLMPADFSYRNMDLDLDGTRKPTRRIDVLLRPMARDYDFTFLDCPPSISLVSENVFRAADALLVPLIPTTLSMRTLAQLDAFLEDQPAKRRPRILAFFSMVDQRKNLHRQLIEQVRAERSDVLDTQIPATSDIERMGVHRAPLATYAPRARSVAAYRELWAEVAARL